MKVQLRTLLTEASRWKELSMQLSPNSINKIKKANISKPDSILADGIWTGTKNILNKHSPGTDIKHERMGFEDFKDSGGAYFQPDYKNNTSTIHVDKNPNFIRKLISPADSIFHNNEKRSLTQAIVGRHEAYEAKHEKGKDTSTGNIYKMKSKRIAGIIPRKQPEAFALGEHNSAKVLTDELRDINKLGYTDTGKMFKKMRVPENNIIKNVTGVDLNTLDTNNNNTFKKANKILDKHESINRYYL